MSNLTQLIAATGPTVAPGTVTSSQYYTSVGWQAGEYIYQTPTSTIAPRTTGGLGYNATTNGGTILSGVSWTPATLQSVQYGPLYDYGTFAGTTQTLGTQVGTTTALTAVASTGNYAFNLINGNICQVWQQASLAWFAIYTPAGVSVVAPTSIAGSSGITAGTQPVSGCCTLGGTIVITFFNGTQHYYATFTQAGVPVVAATLAYAGAVFQRHQTIALADGGWAMAGVPGNNSTMYLTIVTASNTVTVSAQNVNINGMDSAALCQLANGNIAMAGVDSTNSRVGISVCSLSGGSNVYTVYPVSITSSNICNVVALPTGNFVVVYTNTSNNVSVVVYSPTANTQISSASVASTNATSGSMGALQLNASGIPSIYIFGTNNGGASSLWLATFASSTGTTPVITAINNTITTMPNRGWIVNSLNGKVHLCWQATTTNYPSYGFWAHTTLTSGTTVLAGPSYTPKEYYTLLGVAATTVAAGNSGPVITNGASVALNTNYPTVTTPVSFNYQGAINQFAQRGTVVNKVAILKGLEL